MFSNFIRNRYRIIFLAYMSKKNKIAFFLFSLLLIAGVYLYFGLYNIPQMDITATSTEINTSSENLTLSFSRNEVKANSIYKGKIIEVEGIVKDITFLNERNTVLLQGDTKGTSVICDINPSQIVKVKKLKIGQRVAVKGVCKGFLKDVILLNCVLTNQQINE